MRERAPDPNGDASTIKLGPRLAESDSHTNLKRIGALIRNKRRARYSVEQLATLAGVSSGLISQLERGLGNPSLLNLTKLAYALELPLNAFFESQQAYPQSDFVRRDSRRRLLLPDTGLVYELLTPSLDRRLAMLRVVIPPGFDNSGNPFRHEGDECVYLVSGSLEITVAGRRFELNEGDTLTYDAGEPHSWRNSSGAPVDLIGASSPPNF